MRATFSVMQNKLSTLFPEGSLRARLFYGSFWSVVTVLISRGLNLISFIFIARIIGQEDYGALAITQSTVITIGTFAGLGLGMSATKYIASLRIKDPIRAGKIMSLILVITLVSSSLASSAVIIFSGSISTKILSLQNFNDTIVIASALVFVNIFYSVLSGTIAGFEEFKSISINSLISGIISFPIIIICTMFWGINGAILGLITLYFLNCILCSKTIVFLCKRDGLKFSIRNSLNELNIIWKFALPASLGSLISAPVIFITNIMLTRQVDGYSQMAIFNAAQQWQSIVLFLPTAISSMLLSILSNMQSESSKDNFWKTVKISLLSNGLFTALFAICISLFSKFIMNFYGEGFGEGYLILVILSFTAIFIALNNVIGHIIASSYSMWWGFIMNFLWAISMLIVYIFLKDYGATGLSLTYFVSYILHFVWQGLFLRQKSKHRINQKTI